MIPMLPENVLKEALQIIRQDRVRVVLTMRRTTLLKEFCKRILGMNKSNSKSCRRSRSYCPRKPKTCSR